MEATTAGRQGSGPSACQQHGASGKNTGVSACQHPLWDKVHRRAFYSPVSGTVYPARGKRGTLEGDKLLKLHLCSLVHHSCAGRLKWDLCLQPSKDLNLCISSLLTHYLRELAQEDRTGLDRNELPLRQVLSKCRCPNNSPAVPRNRNNLTLKNKLCSDPLPMYQRTMTNFTIFILRPESSPSSNLGLFETSDLHEPLVILIQTRYM